MTEPVYHFPPPKRVMPPELQDLLLEEGSKIEGSDETALGTGIVSILGTARSGKTTLAYGMIDWIMAHTKRPVVLGSFPAVVLEEGVPEHWKGRVSTANPDQMHEIERGNRPVWLLDDAAANFSSRSSMTKKNIAWSKLAGVISHLGCTVIFTSQSLAGVDRTFFRFTEVVTVVRYMSDSGLRGERDEWRDDVDHAQYLLKKIHAGKPGGRRLRSFYVTVSTSPGRKPYRIVPYVRPHWLFEGITDRQRDMLSKPFGYMEASEISAIINGPPKRGRGRPKKTKEENE
jgi:hypothetical protein